MFPFFDLMKCWNVLVKVYLLYHCGMYVIYVCCNLVSLEVLVLVWLHFDDKILECFCYSLHPFAFLFFKSLCWNLLGITFDFFIMFSILLESDSGMLVNWSYGFCHGPRIMLKFWFCNLRHLNDILLGLEYSLRICILSYF